MLHPPFARTAALFRLAAPGSRALERLGLFVGKIIYYLDAAEDYEKDTRNGAYNVFALQGLSKMCIRDRYSAMFLPSAERREM